MSKIDNHLVMVEIVGPRFGRPANDAAATLPFLRDESDTEKVLRVAPIDDETVPYSLVELQTFAIQPSEPYALLEVAAEPTVIVEYMIAPVALDARINLVAIDEPRRASARRGEWIDRTPTRAPAVAPRSRLREVAISAAFLAGALAAGIGLPFLIAAIAR